MNDLEFCKEYVKRMPRPVKSRTKIQMIEIVENKNKVDLEEMFNDDAVEKLYIKHFREDHVGAFVYTYIRDNQLTFIEDK